MQNQTPKTADQVRQAAIEWQRETAEAQSISYQELAEAQAYFVGLADQWPELKEEFIENGII